MKKLISIFLAMLMLVSTSAFAEFEVWPGYGTIPADVYYPPYAENQFVTNYSPWLKNFNMISQWSVEQGQMGGEAAQQIRAMDISPVNPDIMYFGTNTTGVHKSHTGGEHWYCVMNNSVGHNINAVLCDNLDENTVYCYLNRCGVFRSRNGGQSWELLVRDTDKSLEGGYGQLALDSAGNLYMGVSTGIYKLERKTNRLITLVDHSDLAGKDTAGYRDVEVSPDGQHIYAGAYTTAEHEKIKTGITISHDGGKTWKIATIEENKTYAPVEIAIFPGNSDIIYSAGTLTNTATGENDPYGLYISEDRGETWKLHYNFLYSNKEEGHAESYAAFYYLKFGPKNENGVYPLYYCARNTTYGHRVSYDYGKTFEPLFTKEDDIGRGTVRSPFDDAKIYTGWLNQDFAIHPTIPGVVWASTNGIHKFDNGKITYSNGGFSGAGVMDLAVNSEGKLLVAAMDVGLFVTESGTYGNGNYPTMKKIKTSDRSHASNLLIDPSDPDHILVFEGQANGTSGYFGVRQSFNCGWDWDPANEDSKIPTTDIIGSPGNPTVFMYDPFDPNTIYTSYCTSHDNGKTWERTSMYIMAISKKDPKKQVGISGEGKTSELHISYDGGETWKSLGSFGHTYLYSAFFDGADDNYVWYTIRNKGLFKLNVTTGESENYSGMFEYKSFQKLYQNPYNPDHMIFATYHSSGGDRKFNPKNMETRDGGKSWHPLATAGHVISAAYFIEGTTEVLLGSIAGVWIYDYGKYHEYLDSKITIEIDGQEKSFDEQPVIVNGRVMVPMRGLFEALGATVTYDDATRSIKAVKDGKYIILTIGSDKATINGKEITLEAAPYITAKSRTMVPIRFASEALDLAVGWSQAQQKVIIGS